MTKEDIAKERQKIGGRDGEMNRAKEKAQTQGDFDILITIGIQTKAGTDHQKGD